MMSLFLCVVLACMFPFGQVESSGISAHPECDSGVGDNTVVDYPTPISYCQCLRCFCYPFDGGVCEVPDPLCRNETLGEVCGPFNINTELFEAAFDGVDHSFEGYRDCAANMRCSLEAVQRYGMTINTGECEDYLRNQMNITTGDSVWSSIAHCLSYL